MKRSWRSIIPAVGLLVWMPHSIAANEWLVKEGVPRAQILIAEQPPRRVKLASEELRDYVRKISGATLPIVTNRSDAYPVVVCIGRSRGLNKQRQVFAFSPTGGNYHVPKAFGRLMIPTEE